MCIRDSSELTVTQNIARTAFDLSGGANLIFTGDSPEFTNDSINLSSDWTGSVTTQTPNGNRQDLTGPSGMALFNVATVDGVVVTSDAINTEDFGTGSIVHTLADTSSLLLGDVNGDEIVSFADVSPFIALLSTSGFQEEADINRSGTVDFADVSPFIAILSSQ